MTIQERLFKHKSKKYADFCAKLTPNIAREKFIGVKVPVIRKIAKEIAGSKEATDFLKALPHEYYEENLLHAAIVSLEGDFDKCIKAIDKFLPHVDNWAVCDTMNPKVLGKNKPALLQKINEWTESGKTYTVRFAIRMLMNNYLGKGFDPKLLDIPRKAQGDDYYVNMMCAWFYAEALIKRWNETIPYIEGRILNNFVHSKTIQKACESFRVPENHKEMLKNLRGTV